MTEPEIQTNIRRGHSENSNWIAQETDKEGDRTSERNKQINKKKERNADMHTNKHRAGERVRLDGRMKD